ncbi:uncharacterized protein LOC113321282 [Papaver somniferum]|uniref:uncharacterized protein LOC113321282 n=1 Tax=Papaver somniferum TaxID=3469 RepID=UPI000E6FF67F|nr:uncharacterized protein LOC113321282 [Papaver somniferum]
MLMSEEGNKSKRAKVSSHINMPTEMVSETTAKSLDKDGAQEEKVELTNQVLEEIDIDTVPQLSPVRRVGAATKILNEGVDVARKHKEASKTDFLLDLLLNTIWEKGEMLHQEDEASQKETDLSEAETVIQYKFSYGVEKPVAKEKSDYEEEMDQLWGEMEKEMAQLWGVIDFALRPSEGCASAPYSMEGSLVTPCEPVVSILEQHEIRVVYFPATEDDGEEIRILPMMDISEATLKTECMTTHNLGSGVLLINNAGNKSFNNPLGEDTYEDRVASQMACNNLLGILSNCQEDDLRSIIGGIIDEKRNGNLENDKRNKK